MYVKKRIKAWLFGIRTGNWSCYCSYCGEKQMDMIGCLNAKCPGREKIK